MTALKAGAATVTVTTADGGKTASCQVTVTEQVKIVITGNTAKVPVDAFLIDFRFLGILRIFEIAPSKSKIK